MHNSVREGVATSTLRGLTALAITAVAVAAGPPVPVVCAAASPDIGANVATTRVGGLKTDHTTGAAVVSVAYLSAYTFTVSIDDQW